jgi:hypothetical protein
LYIPIAIKGSSAGFAPIHPKITNTEIKQKKVTLELIEKLFDLKYLAYKIIRVLKTTIAPPIDKTPPNLLGIDRNTA